jgi:hypothetical protein
MATTGFFYCTVSSSRSTILPKNPKKFFSNLQVIVAFALCLKYYTGTHFGDCKLHEFFILFNFILCVIQSVVSVLPAVQEHQPSSGLLQVQGWKDLLLTW